MTTSNCNHPNFDKDCGKYVKAYLGNLEYVSDALLEIINEKILKSENGQDVLDDECKCKDFSHYEDTENAIVFNCDKWNEIKDKLIIVSSDESDNYGILRVLCDTIKCYLEKTYHINHAFAAQLERLHCLCESLETRLDSIVCNNKCPEIIGDLLCLLMQILTKLISVVAKVSTLIYYADCYTTHDNKVVKTFFECMLCDFINDLCELEKLIQELTSIVIGFATCDMHMCTPCFTTPCAPKKVRPICPPNLMHGGNYGYGANHNGGCPCNKR